MWTFLASKRVWIGVVGLVAVIIAAMVIDAVRDRREAKDEQLINSGAVKERGANADEVLNRVEKAIEVERNASGELTNSVRCKYDRNAPSDCK